MTVQGYNGAGGSARKRSHSLLQFTDAASTANADLYSNVRSLPGRAGCMYADITHHFPVQILDVFFLTRDTFLSQSL